MVDGKWASSHVRQPCPCISCWDLHSRSLGPLHTRDRRSVTIGGPLHSKISHWLKRPRPPSSIHTRRWRLKGPWKLSWMKSLHGFLYSKLWIMFFSQALPLRGRQILVGHGMAFGWELRALTITWSWPLARVWIGPWTNLETRMIGMENNMMELDKKSMMLQCSYTHNSTWGLNILLRADDDMLHTQQNSIKVAAVS